MVYRKDAWAKILGDGADNYYATATPAEQNYFKEWMQGLLKESEVTVDFEKINGEFRSMKCTLSENLGAKYAHKNATEKTRPSNPDVCVVWDLNQSAWRSFRWDRVKRIQFDIG